MAESTLLLSEPFAIDALIKSRCHVLGLNKAQFVRLAGDKNESKAIRRLDALIAGDLETTGRLIQGLSAALDLPDKFVHRAVQDKRPLRRNVGYEPLFHRPPKTTASYIKYLKC